MKWRTLKHLMLFSVAMALSACSAANKGAQGTFRDLDAPIGATTRFDPVAFAGEWQIIASYTPLRQETVSFSLASEASGLTLSSNEIPAYAGFYQFGAPGELIPIDTRQERLIVMWVDDGFRTAAIGTPSGSFGVVLNRTGDIPADRALAAREVFSFYGWRVSELKRTVQ